MILLVEGAFWQFDPGLEGFYSICYKFNLQKKKLKKENNSRYFIMQILMFFIIKYLIIAKI